MRQFVGRGALWATFVVVAWRGLSELVIRRRELAAAGLLAPRIAARRADRIGRALAAAGFSGRERVVVHASVHVGAVRPADVDDVGLLEAAMRRAARERTLVAADGMHAATLAPRVEVRGEVDGSPARERARANQAWWLVPLALAAVALTLVPLVRPLDPAAPWFALAGGALASAAWLASRRR